MLSGETESISNDVREIISDFSNIVLVSSLSVMELIFLFKNGKIKTTFKTASEIEAAISDRLYIEILHTKPEHFKTYSKLEIANNHKDQIDHFIISQAVCEEIPLISSDKKFKEYISQNLDFVYNKR